MDDFHQSAAPVARRRRSASGRRLLGLIVVLALMLLLPARALADRTSTVILQPIGAGLALTTDAASEDPPPADPRADTSEPAPAPDPAPAPSDPAPPEPTPSDPAPSDPAPPPSDPAPAPSDPAPAPTEPAPAPSEPAPAPSDPAPPADEVPVDPAPSEPAPADPAPRDGRATAPKPPASDERQLPSTAPTPTPLALAAPATSTASTTTGPGQAADPAKPAGGTTDQTPAKVVRAAYRRLGLGTIATPAPLEGTAPTAAVAAQACTPIGTVAAAGAPQAGNGLAPHTAVRTHRGNDEPPAVRGPPAPLDAPSSPIATAAAGSAGTGGAGGDRDCAILADQIVFTLADGGCAAASACSDHVAPAPANAAARAPPAV